MLYLSVHLYITDHIYKSQIIFNFTSHIITYHNFWCTCLKWRYLQAFFCFLKILIFWVVSGVRGQKIFQNDKKLSCGLCLSNHKSYCFLRCVQLTVHTHTHTSKFLCVIFCMPEIINFLLLVLLLLYISHKKFFIEGFFIEDYVKEM